MINTQTTERHGILKREFSARFNWLATLISIPMAVCRLIGLWKRRARVTFDESRNQSYEVPTRGVQLVEQRRQLPLEDESPTISRPSTRRGRRIRNAAERVELATEMDSRSSGDGETVELLNLEDPMFR